ncbi:four helix bundle protein [Candidatus Berkelbacteria bacterium]|nr:four helix bundle protein [Candidatus Berkelbacteria bacterium]
MSNEAQSSKSKYDLEERTASFGEKVIEFVQGLPDNHIVRPLVGQLVRSATSIGANYAEADAAGSKKDFRYKIMLCKKESRETRHWIRMVARANLDKKNKCRELWQEAQEFLLIFSAILKK